jgi:hypothetical protein
MAEIEARTQRFVGEAWQPGTPPKPELLLDDGLRTYSAALGRIVVPLDYFHTVAHIKVTVPELLVLERKGLVKWCAMFGAVYMDPYNVYTFTPVQWVPKQKITGVHHRVIIERPVDLAIEFMKHWMASFGEIWPLVGRKTIHPWLAPYVEGRTISNKSWLEPGGARLENFWNDNIQQFVMRDYPHGKRLVSPILQHWRPPCIYCARAKICVGEEIKPYIPPTGFDISRLLGRTALASDWGESKVASVVLLPSEVRSPHADLRGVFGYMASGEAKEETHILHFELELTNDITQINDLGQVRLIVDRSRDKEFLTTWRQTHGQAWPRPLTALPRAVQVMLEEYNDIMDEWRLPYGRLVADHFDNFVAAQKQELAKLGIQYGDIDDINRRAARRKSTRGPGRVDPPTGSTRVSAELPAKVSEVSAIEKEIEEQNRELTRLKKAQKGMVPSLIKPSSPSHTKVVKNEPVETASSKEHRKKSKNGQRVAETERKAAERVKEQTYEFLKETALGFHIDSRITGEPSAEQIERAANTTARAQIAADRRMAKQLERDDTAQQVADIFGL